MQFGESPSSAASRAGMSGLRVDADSSDIALHNISAAWRCNYVYKYLNLHLVTRCNIFTKDI